MYFDSFPGRYLWIRRSKFQHIFRNVLGFEFRPFCINWPEVSFSFQLRGNLFDFQPFYLKVFAIYIAVLPVLTWLERLNYRMPFFLKVLCCVLVFWLVTATHVPADQTDSQVNPAVSDFQTFLASLWTRLYSFYSYHICVCAYHRIPLILTFYLVMSTWIMWL